MDERLYKLYSDLLLTELKDGRKVYDRINPEDLCIAGHHKGKRYNGGLLIYGQAMNGWGNEEKRNVDSIVNEVMRSSEDPREMHWMANYKGWHGTVNGKEASYFYKRSKFWKLNYQVITGGKDNKFKDFYVYPKGNENYDELLDKAWPQTVGWSNLYKISFSKGGNPDREIINAINNVSREIVLREIELLKPAKVLFNTGQNFFCDLAGDGSNQENIFGLEKVEGQKNILYRGIYEGIKMVVCKRPDERKDYYANTDIVREAEDILDAFKNI